MTTSTITPELALVDPEHARVARQLLPEHNHRTAAIARTVAAVPIPIRPSKPRLARRKPALAGAVLATLVGAAASCLVAAALMLDTGKRPGAGPADAPRERDRTTQLRQAQQASWPAIPGTRSYQITLTRNGNLVYNTTTQHTKLALPTRLRLAPGHYTWTVTPNSSSREEISHPLVTTTFQIPTQ